jgi:hypothetical protein
MRNLIIFVLLSLNLTAQKSPKDIVDFKNFDYVFAENLLHEKFNSELVKISEEHHPLKKDSIAYKAIEYQLSHFKNEDEVNHDNKKPFRNVLLVTPRDRIEFFNKKRVDGLSIEVATKFTEIFTIRDTTKKQWYIKEYDKFGNLNMIKTEKVNDGRLYFTYDVNTSKYTHINDLNTLYSDLITYEKIVDEIYTNFMILSVWHRFGIEMASKNNMVCFWKIEVTSTKNSFTIWSGSVFYNKE